MSNEANISELILEAYWKIQGYWTKVRLPYDKNDTVRKKDFDLLAYDPVSKTLVVGEAKAQSTIHRVYFYHSRYNKKFNDEFKGYIKFIGDINNLWSSDLFLKDCKKDQFEKVFDDKVDKLVIHLLSNTYIEELHKQKTIESVEKYFKDENKWKFNIEIEIKLDNFMDIFTEIFMIQGNREQSRSYENHILDFIWEFHRYTKPCFQGQQGDGKNDADAKEKAKDLKAEYYTNIGKKFNDCFIEPLNKNKKNNCFRAL